MDVRAEHAKYLELKDRIARAISQTKWAFPEPEPKQPNPVVDPLSKVFVPVIVMSNGRRFITTRLVWLLSKQEVLDDPRYAPTVQLLWGEEVTSVL